ncbi:MAG: phospho-sugar mutase [Acidimicrobiia bacterium]|nr:phospho-sugar mutase [Acidimicrobiia bacterium]
MKVEDLEAEVRRWIEGDPDPITRDELTDLLVSGAWEDLADRFADSLEFGTAGLRGIDGGGPNRMNLAVVVRATYGLSEYLKSEDAEGPVVVGRDARERSLDYFDATVRVLVAAGFEVLTFPDPIPTPIVAFAARELEARAAIVITASHNPPEYNGYKVYNNYGAQIVPPTDEQIAHAISLAPPASMIAMSSEGGTILDRQIIDRYLDAIVRPTDSGLSIAYTPLHGVGGIYAREVLERSGHSVAIAADQFKPDPEFPSVRFPNPEEAGAMDEVMELGREVAADLVMANDPDADRLAVGSPEQGMLTGNQLGVLVIDGILARWSSQATPIVASTVVSTPMARQVAEARGAHFAETLTGFKWIWRALLSLVIEGEREFAVGFEEALGYSVSPVVRDKDGLSAAAVVAEIASDLAREGKTLWDRFDELCVEFGAWRSTQRSIVRTGPDGHARLVQAVAEVASRPPSDLAGRQVEDIVDYRTGEEERPPWLPNTNMVVLAFDAGRVIVRPSGTEPKLKVYADLACDDESDLVALADAAVHILEI